MSKYEYFSGSFEEHILGAIIFFLLGTIGNGLVIHIYFKKNTHAIGNFLVLVLTSLDLVACYSFSLFKVTQDLNALNLNDNIMDIIFRIRMGTIRFFLRGNLWLLCIMAIDRTWAIKRPYTYRSFRNRLPLVVAFTLISLGIESTLSSIFYLDDNITTALSLIIVALVLLVTYPIIIYAIYKRKKTKIGVSNVKNSTACSTFETLDNSVENQKR